MGVYVYTLSATNCRNMSFYGGDGWSVTGLPRKVFIMKRHNVGDVSGQSMQAAIRAVKRKDYENYVVMNNFGNYNHVYRLQDGVYHWLDGYPFPGEVVGKIIRPFGHPAVFPISWLPDPRDLIAKLYEHGKTVGDGQRFIEAHPRSGYHYYDIDCETRDRPQCHRVYNFNENNQLKCIFTHPFIDFDPALVQPARNYMDFNMEILSIHRKLSSITGKIIGNKTIVIPAYYDQAVFMYATER